MCPQGPFVNQADDRAWRQKNILFVLGKKSQAAYRSACNLPALFWHPEASLLYVLADRLLYADHLCQASVSSQDAASAVASVCSLLSRSVIVVFDPVATLKGSYHTRTPA